MSKFVVAYGLARGTPGFKGMVRRETVLLYTDYEASDVFAFHADIHAVLDMVHASVSEYAQAGSVPMPRDGHLPLRPALNRGGVVEFDGEFVELEETGARVFRFTTTPVARW